MKLQVMVGTESLWQSRSGRHICTSGHNQVKTQSLRRLLSLIPAGFNKFEVSGKFFKPRLFPPLLRTRLITTADLLLQKIIMEH